MTTLINNVFPLSSDSTRLQKVVTVNNESCYWTPEPGEKVVIDESCGVLRVWRETTPEGMQVGYTWPRGALSFEDMANRVRKHWKKKAWWL